ncbi:MAG: hypothetical protein J6N76_06115, partial [Lachnospiraceae bacterium]|nr:hypothetical protein [Lachnospiraceae bacterium]
MYESIEATMNEKALKDDVYAPIEAMITEKAGKKVNLDIDVKGDGLYELDNLKEMTDLPNQESKDMLRVNIYLKKMEKIDKKKRQWYDKMLKLLEDDSDISNEAAEKIERELGLDKIKVSGSQTDPEYAEQFQGAIRLSNKIRTYLLFGDDANKTDEERQEKEDYNLARERLVDTVDYCESDETKEFLKKIKDNYFNLMDTKPRQHLESPFMKKVQAENQKLIDQKKAIELEKEKKAKEEKEKEEKLKEVKQEETEKPAEKENKEEKPKVIKRKVQAVRQPERNLTQEEIRENSIKRINETFEETKNRIEEEIKKTGQARVMDERKKNSSDKKKWDEDCLTYDDDCYRGYQYSNENIQISEIKPKLSDLRQTSGSTCYLYSALAGIVATNPGYITNELIRDDPKDQAFCIVKLYDAKSRVNYIRVRKSYEKRTFNWSHLVFKAATVLIEKDENKAVFRVGDVPHGKLEINDLDLGDEQLASRLFLGTKGKLLDLRDRVPDDKLDEFNAGEDVTHDGQECIDGDKAIGTLLAYINVGKMVVASTCTNDYAGDGKYHYKGDRVKFSCPLLNEKHAYRVVGEGTPDPITKERKLRLWDPLRSGEIEITFEDFKKHFTYGMIMDTRENDLYNKNNWKADEEDIEEEENLDEEENIEVEEEREEEEKRLKEEEKRLKEEEEKRLKEEEESSKKEEERRHIEEVAQKMREEFERSQEEQRKKEEEKK